MSKSSLLTQQNLVLSSVAALLLVTYAAIGGIQFAKKPPLSSPTNVVQRNPVDNIEQEKHLEYTRLLEPGLFEVKIPEVFNKPPERISQVIKDSYSQQSAPYTLFRYSGEDRSFMYEVGYMRLPDELFEQKSKSQILNDLREGELDRFQGVLKKETTLYESPNLLRRELIIESSAFTDTMYARTNLILSPPYAFLLSYSAKSKQRVHTQQINEFFSSLTLYEGSSPSTVIVDASGIRKSF